MKSKGIYWKTVAKWFENKDFLPWIQNVNGTYIMRLEDHQDNLDLIYVQCRGNFKLSYKEHLYHVEVAPKNFSEMDYAKRIIFFLKKWNCLIFS